MFNHPISLSICSLNSTYGKIVKHLSSPQKSSLITGITPNRQHRNRILKESKKNSEFWRLQELQPGPPCCTMLPVLQKSPKTGTQHGWPCRTTLPVSRGLHSPKFLFLSLFFPFFHHGFFPISILLILQAST